MSRSCIILEVSWSSVLCSLAFSHMVSDGVKSDEAAEKMEKRSNELMSSPGGLES